MAENKSIEKAKEAIRQYMELKKKEQCPEVEYVINKTALQNK